MHAHVCIFLIISHKYIIINLIKKSKINNHIEMYANDGNCIDNRM